MEERYQEIFRKIPLPSLLIKREGDIFRPVDANKAYEQEVGVKKKELLLKTLVQSFPSNPRKDSSGYSLLIHSISTVFETGKSDRISEVRYDLFDPDRQCFKEKYWEVLNMPVCGEKGEVRYVLNCIKDITGKVKGRQEEARLKEQLSRQQEKHRHFIERNSDAISILNRRGKFLYVNEGLSHLTEMSQKSLLKTDFQQFCTQKDHLVVLEYFARALKGEALEFEASFLSANGTLRLLKISLMPYFHQGRVEEIYMMARDVSNFRKTQRVLVEKAKYLEVNAFMLTSLLENELLNDHSLSMAFAEIGKTVKVDRMYYFEASGQDGSGEFLISQKVEWCNQHADPQIDNPEMQNMPASELQEILGDLVRNRVFTVKRRELPQGRLQEIFLDQDIRSILLVPVFFRKKFYGFLGYDDCRFERTWTDEEVVYLKNIANKLSAGIEKRETEKAIRKQKETLRRTEQKSRALFQEASDFVAILDETGHFKMVSGPTLDLLGMAPSEYLEQNALDHIHPEDMPRLRKAFEELELRRRIKIAPFRYMRKDGGWRWLETTISCLLDDSAVMGIVANSRDVHKEVLQAREIRETNERYRLAAKATRDIIYDWNLETDEVVRHHKASEAELGYSEEELNSKHFWRQHIHPSDLVRERAKLEKFFNDPSRDHVGNSYRFRRKDGSYAKFIDRGYIIRDENGRAIRLVGAASDISELAEKEEALKTANKRFTIAMKATNEMIWDWDVVKNTVVRSKGFKTIFGFLKQEKDSSMAFWMDKIVEEDKERVWNSLKDALESGRTKTWREVYRIKKPDGTIAHVVDRGYIIRNKRGENIRVVGSVRDETGSRKLMSEISKQNTLLREIAWEQSHVVRAPLARILGLIPFLKNNNPKERGKIAAHIEDSAEELDQIVRAIINKTEKIDFNESPTPIT